nr:MAG TPA: hypothetical protein [Caudoviricetes sp.]
MLHQIQAQYLVKIDNCKLDKELKKCLKFVKNGISP